MSKRSKAILISAMALLAASVLSGGALCAGEHLSVADQAEHPALMETDEDGCFHPYKKVTRIQACQAVAGLLELPSGNIALADLKVWNDGYRAVAELYSGGVLELEAGDSFRPNELITREEMAELLLSVGCGLDGKEAARAIALSADTMDEALGWEGSCISRGELACILVTLAGREPTEAETLLCTRLPADVTVRTDGWIYIGDAVTDGVTELPESGPCRADGWLYCLDENDELLRDRDIGVWTFGLDGAYTTGDETLDSELRRALELSGANGLDGGDALQAVYLYVKDNFEYRISPEEMETVPENTTGWEYERARLFFANGGGTCYSYAAAFGLLARCLGYEAYIISAEVNQYYAPHGFVVIPEDGTDYIYDVEMEDTRPERHDDLDLFGIRNKTVYYYWYETQW